MKEEEFISGYMEFIERQKDLVDRIVESVDLMEKKAAGYKEIYRKITEIEDLERNVQITLRSLHAKLDDRAS